MDVHKHPVIGKLRIFLINIKAVIAVFNYLLTQMHYFGDHAGLNNDAIVNLNSHTI